MDRPSQRIATQSLLCRKSTRWKWHTHMRISLFILATEPTKHKNCTTITPARRAKTLTIAHAHGKLCILLARSMDRRMLASQLLLLAATHSKFRSDSDGWSFKNARATTSGLSKSKDKTDGFSIMVGPGPLVCQKCNDIGRTLGR